MARRLLTDIINRDHHQQLTIFYSLKNAPTVPPIQPRCGWFGCQQKPRTQPIIIHGGFARWAPQRQPTHKTKKRTATASRLGLAHFCRQEKIDLIILAVSPFATTMAATAHKVAAQLHLPLWSLQPQPWTAHSFLPSPVRWLMTNTNNQSVTVMKNSQGVATPFYKKILRNLLAPIINPMIMTAEKKILFATDKKQLLQLTKIHRPPPAQKILLALGAKDGEDFLSLWGKQQGIARRQQGQQKNQRPLPTIIWRSIYPTPAVSNNLPIERLLSPPQSRWREQLLLRQQHIGLVVAKNSGGDHNPSRHKITAAYRLDCRVILLDPHKSHDAGGKADRQHNVGNHHHQFYHPRLLALYLKRQYL